MDMSNDHSLPEELSVYSKTTFRSDLNDRQFASNMKSVIRKRQKQRARRQTTLSMLGSVILVMIVSLGAVQMRQVSEQLQYTNYWLEESADVYAYVECSEVTVDSLGSYLLEDDESWLYYKLFVEEEFDSEEWLATLDDEQLELVFEQLESM